MERFADLAAFVDLPPEHLLLLAFIVFGAGVVRGFSGFALSALVMAAAVMILPPVELLAICWWLEIVASMLMARGNWAEADRRTVLGLAIGSTVGVPIGLSLTTTLPIDTSRMIVLVLILGLAATQLARIRLPFLATRPGLYGSGLLAGVATGLASIGGMVVALHVLASRTPARQMRAALVLFLLASSITTLASQLWFGVMDGAAVRRGLVLAPMAALGVTCGKMLFLPRFERWYRPLCLSLLMALAALTLARTALT